jgi:DNA-binding NarL/FixJ family response regulator
MNVKEIESIIRNYHWMSREIVRLENELRIAPGLKGSQADPSESKRSSAPGDPVQKEVLRREEKRETLEDLLSKIQFITNYEKQITELRERTVLHCLLDGMNIGTISQHLKYSKRTIYLIKESLVKKFYDLHKLHE